MSRIEDGGAVERLRERAISNGKYLGELLAVIHRDGGHYQALHGDAKAVTDAIQAVFSLHTTGADARDQLAASAAEITRLRAENAGMQEAQQIAMGALDALAFVHDGNPSDAMADMPAIDYARHMLLEVRKIAKAAASDARAALSKASQAERTDTMTTREDILSLAAEALKPFAEEAAEWELGYSDDEMIDTENVIRVGDLRRASRVLALLSAAPTPPATEARPFGWARGVNQPATPHGPAEFDVDFDYGDDAPSGEGWFPLYVTPPTYADAEARIAELEKVIEEDGVHMAELMTKYEALLDAEAKGFARGIEAAAKAVDRIEGERIPIPCPDGIRGCLVAHFKIKSGPIAAAIRSLASPAPKGET